MSHEFRTPLNSILALSRLLQDGVDGAAERRAETPGRLHPRSAQTLLEMVNDLLDLAKVEAGKVEMQPELVLGRVAVRRAARLAAPAARRIPTWSSPSTSRDGLPDAARRRTEGRADPAQLHLQRAQVHRARLGARQRAPRRAATTRSCSPSRTPASASTPKTMRAHLRGVLADRPVACRKAAPAWDCRFRAGWRF